ncbi:uncharacterized protein LOC126317471 [Schistocerca gregaria]|uniref:uncharacterized protein LOC126317471 n=1 Tax=Schistocerca gregaria TaxID=7010 RepID=UPI00211E1A12|nr:uncharacterized protein LOC126317471 [Schistocerca gregaria]
MDLLIPSINKTHDVLSSIGEEMVELPNIVVIGSQSSGKSSVLENLVGRDFLPRGTGIVTRCPLSIQLHNIPNIAQKPGSDSPINEWGEFAHIPQKTFDFAQIKQQISQETMRIAGSNKTVSSEEIVLKIFSPNVVNLRLVDLPGIAKVPVGNQPANIEECIRNMIMTYISRPNSIILAVSAANTDLANSDALKLAYTVDPLGDRTIGVITKLDLMDAGTDALEILKGNLFRLKLGYYAVLNRSQRDNIKNVSIQESLKHEEEYFKTHSAYKSVQHQCGTRNLSIALSNILNNSIKTQLPKIRATIQRQLIDTRQALSSYSFETKSVSDKRQIVILLSNDFYRRYQKVIFKPKNTQEIYGGGRINYIFQNIFASSLANMADSICEIPREQVLETIRNASGIFPILFLPKSAFEILIKSRINLLRKPCIACVDLVYSELISIINGLKPSKIVKYERIYQEMIRISTDIIEQCRTPCYELVNNLITIEHSYINFDHPDFIASKQNFELALTNSSDDLLPTKPQAPPRTKKGTTYLDSNDTSSAEEDEDYKKNAKSPVVGDSKPLSNAVKRKELLKFYADKLVNLIFAYYKIVIKSITDIIPKTINLYLVDKSIELIQASMPIRLLSSEYEEVLNESISGVEAEKNVLEVKIKSLTKAMQILNEIK